MNSILRCLDLWWPQAIFTKQPLGSSYSIGSQAKVIGSTLAQDDKPEGFMVCHKCQTLLAIRKCEATSCQCSLCFGCYRAVHLAMPTVRASRGDHDGVPCKPIDCCKCKAAAAAAAATTPADRHCHECDLDLCKSCFARIHRSPLLAMHAWSKI